MCLDFREKTEARRLAKPVQEHMVRRFNLLPEYLNMLRYFEYDGVFRGEPVKQVRIFSPDMAKESGVTIRKSSDLEQHPEMLLFMGHIDGRGQVYVADRRPANWQTKVG